MAAQADLLRDIFGNPFRPLAIDPAWLTSTITALAAQMYESNWPMFGHDAAGTRYNSAEHRLTRNNLFRVRPSAPISTAA